MTFARALLVACLADAIALAVLLWQPWTGLEVNYILRGYGETVYATRGGESDAWTVFGGRDLTLLAAATVAVLSAAGGIVTRSYRAFARPIAITGLLASLLVAEWLLFGDRSEVTGIEPAAYLSLASSLGLAAGGVVIAALGRSRGSNVPDSGREPGVRDVRRGG